MSRTGLASNARIFELGLSDGCPLALMGTDGELLRRCHRGRRWTCSSSIEDTGMMMNFRVE